MTCFLISIQIQFTYFNLLLKLFDSVAYHSLLGYNKICRDTTLLKLRCSRVENRILDSGEPHHRFRFTMRPLHRPGTHS